MKQDYLGLDTALLKQLGGYYTANEIWGQPELWKKTYHEIAAQKNQIAAFLKPVFSLTGLEIILTGAGSSAFIGESAAGLMQRNLKLTARDIATTDLATHPELYLQKTRPTLLISFARSGSSPESLQAVKLADDLCNHIYHLIITCNPDGELAGYGSRENSFVFILPPEANDQSLAMTGSFSSMLLSVLLVSKLDRLDDQETHIKTMAEYGSLILNEFHSALKEVAQMDFERAVFLGSGSLQGIAQESHLKLQELTDGKIICKHDSYLGFRHGPKAVIDDKTLLVYLMSSNAYVHQYERDLIDSIHNVMYTIGVNEKPFCGLSIDLKISMEQEKNRLPEEYWAICVVMPAQILGFYKSLTFGLSPDSPSINGVISRVVEGVQLYDYEESK